MKLNKLSSLLVLTAVGVLATQLTSCKKDQEESKPTYAYDDLTVRACDGENGVVAAANPYAANAGLDVLKAGGNAFDAAVATSFALGVCEPHCSSIGGGGILVGWDATKQEFVSYNFREFVPELGKADVYAKNGDSLATRYSTVKAVDYNELEDEVRSIGVPTQVASLLTILDERGNFKNTQSGRESVIGPARNLAKNGFKVTAELKSAIDGEPCWQESREQRKIFGQDGTRMPIGLGETMKNEALANVYGKIIDQGKDGFYKGEIANKILAAAGVNSAENSFGNKGLITQADLDYAVENYPLECAPTTGTYKGYDIVSSAPPSSGGIILVEALNMLEAYCDTYGELTDLGHNTPEYINLMSTVTQLAYGDKQKWIGDDKFVDVPKKGLVNKTYAQNRFLENYTEGSQYNGKYSQKVSKGDPGAVTQKDPGDANKELICSATGGKVNGQNFGRADWYDPDFSTKPSTLRLNAEITDNDEHYSTTSFSCADKYGNVVTITQTINHFFGAHIMPEGCGFYLNNQLSSFGITPGRASYIEPYKNPTSHIMPTIILKDGKAVATLGSPGSMRLVTAVFETVVNLLEWDFDEKTQTWNPREIAADGDVNMQASIEGARAYSYCVSTSSDNGAGDNVGDEDHKPLYLEVSVEGERSGTIVKKSDITEETARILAEDYGYAVNRYDGRNLFFGGVQGITFDSRGRMHGGADVRRDGKALGY